MAEVLSTDTGDDSYIQSEEVDQKIKELHDSGRPVTILVIGPAGAGKSELVNAMFGKDVAEVGHGVASVTSEVNEYKGEYKGVNIKIYDAVGFRDTKGKSNHSILLDIAKHRKFDLILICTKLEDRADYIMFSELASSLCEDMWKRTIVVLTFTNMFVHLKSVVRMGPDKAVAEKIVEYKEFVAANFSNHCNKKILLEIPYCIAGLEDEKKLPTTDDWLKSLWDMCILRCSNETRPFLKAYARYRLLSKMMNVVSSASIGAGIGAMAGSAVPVAGTILGGILGAGIGAGVSFASNFDSEN